MTRSREHVVGCVKLRSNRRFPLPVLFAAALLSVFNLYGDDQSEAEKRYHNLIEEFRCPKCLNTNLAGSDAPIAQDLKKRVKELIHEGKTDDEIRDYLRDRYGDFILYDPPLKPGTLALWVLPIVLILLAIWVVLKTGVRKEPVALNPAEQARLEELNVR